jgi:hypothetical protein
MSALRADQKGPHGPGESARAATLRSTCSPGTIRGSLLIAGALLLAAKPISAQANHVVVEGRAESLIGVADTATGGQVGQADLAMRPLGRVGELLEAVPGVIITQHSGAGKGNQLFLRGFNLDHGTDLRTTVAGIPVNLPSHGHGQGYTDLNFMIPELVEEIRYRKGPYLARDGDFSSAGAVEIDYVRKLERGLAQIEVGSFGHRRGLFAQSYQLDGGDLLLAVEGRHGDGPWDVPDDYDRINGVARYARGDEQRGYSVMAMGYSGTWTATDHVARRAIERGEIGRFGSLDPTSGGDSSRYSMHAQWWQQDQRGATRASAWALASDLDLFSNFTYFLVDEVAGDQIEQTDRRYVFGLDGEQQWFGDLAGLDLDSTVGAQLRSDFISNGLHSSAARRRAGTVRRDTIRQHMLSLWAENRVQWASKVRSVVGLRGDAVLMDVASDRAANSDDRADAIVSPKAGLVFGPFADTEFYLNAGYGFHSNDARGATLRDDPTTPDPDDGVRVNPLVRSRGAEVGLRTTCLPGLHSSLAGFVLDLDSELVFVGDAGNTEAARGSRRYGVEWTNAYAPAEWISLDADLTWTHARFRGDDPGGQHIPGAIDTVVAAGLTLRSERFFGTLRTRYFGPRSLIEDNSVRSRVSWLLNLRLGAHVGAQTTVMLDVINLLDEKDHDIEYFYASRLAGEAPGPDDGGYNDVHLHPVEPFSLRFAVQTRF